MKWLEIIELRSVESNRKLLEPKLKKILDEFHRAAGKPIIKVYNRFDLDSDLSIHLLHSSSNADNNGSQVGVQLVSALKEFGLTNHSIWIEKSGE